MRSHSRVKTQQNKRPSAIDPRRSASQTGWVSLLWITPLFAGRLTPPRTKSLIHGKKGTVSAGPLLLPLLRPHRARLCRLAALLSRMFSLGFALGLHSKTSQTHKIRILRTAYCPSLWARHQTQPGEGGQSLPGAKAWGRWLSATELTRIDSGGRIDELVSTEKCDVDTENRGQTCLLVQYPHCSPSHLNAGTH